MTKNLIGLVLTAASMNRDKGVVMSCVLGGDIQASVTVDSADLLTFLSPPAPEPVKVDIPKAAEVIVSEEHVASALRQAGLLTATMSIPIDGRSPIQIMADYLTQVLNNA